MFINIHGEMVNVSVDVNASAGADNTLVAASPTTETFLHMITLGTDTDTVITLKLNSTVIGTFKLLANGSVNMSDLNGMWGEPVIKALPTQAIKFASSAAARITGMVKYSRKEATL